MLAMLRRRLKPHYGFILCLSALGAAPAVAYLHNAFYDMANYATYNGPDRTATYLVRPGVLGTGSEADSVAPGATVTYLSHLCVEPGAKVVGHLRLISLVTKEVLLARDAVQPDDRCGEKWIEMTVPASAPVGDAEAVRWISSTGFTQRQTLHDLLPPFMGSLLEVTRALPTIRLRISSAATGG